jgi:hypothetical protein
MVSSFFHKTKSRSLCDCDTHTLTLYVVYGVLVRGLLSFSSPADVGFVMAVLVFVGVAVVLVGLVVVHFLLVVLVPTLLDPFGVES